MRLVTTTKQDGAPGSNGRTGEAIAMLGRLIGDWVDVEPAARCRACAALRPLPLALRVIAELAIARPSTPLAELLAEPHDLARPGAESFAAV